MSPLSSNERSTARFLDAEYSGWEELQRLIDLLSPQQAEIRGYTPDWSAKDFLAHLAGWLSEAGQVLMQVRSGAFIPTDVDVDARNHDYVEANRVQPLPVVLLQLKRTRRRLLNQLHGLEEIPAAAAPSLEKAGPDHYSEHLPRFREWVAELSSNPQSV